jgi:SLT domain-containing protein/phage-related protein
VSSVGSVSLRVLPDTSQFSTRLSQQLRNAGSAVAVPIELDRSSIATYRAHVANLTRPVTLPVLVQLERAALAQYRAQLANLTRPQQVDVSVNLQGEQEAQARLGRLAEDRTSNVRVDVDQSAASSISRITSAAGSALGAVAGLGSKLTLLGSAAPAVGALVSTVAAIAPAAAVAVPAVAALGSALGAIKLGTSGLGDAFKEAFNPAASAASGAASAARQVEQAQRSLADAQRAVGDAQRAAAEQVAQAQKAVIAAERDLLDAQREAKRAQEDLTDAREEARRALQDMQLQLSGAKLDEREAVLRVKEAQEELNKTLLDPRASETDKERAQLRLDQAKQGLKEQQVETRRLARDTADAAEAGVEGSDQVKAAKDRLAQANQNVADKTQAVKDAEAAVAKTQADGARQVADAKRAVADASRALAEAQAASAAQTAKLTENFSKLSPNAQSFVNAVKGLKPAWDSMKLGVQDRLFAGLGSRLSDVGARVIPILRSGLEGTAGVLNQMAKGALEAVDNLAKTGMLKQILDGATKSLGPLKNAPKQIVTALGQVAVAAQPSFERIMQGLGGVIDRVTEKIGKAFESGKLEDAISTAVDLLGDLLDVAGNLGTIFKNVFMAGSEEGGGFIGVLKTITAEIAKVTASPQVQGGLQALFSVMGTLATTAAPLLGEALKWIGEIFQQLGPPLEVVISELGKALGPVLEELGPVAVEIARAFGEILVALSPLLPVLGDLLVAALKPLVPVFGVIGDAIARLSPVISEVAKQLGPALTPVVEGLVKVIAQLVTDHADLFLEILEEIKPVLPELLTSLVQLGITFGNLLAALAPLLPQITMLAVRIVGKLLPVLIEIAPYLIKLIDLFLRFATKVIEKIVVPAVIWLSDKLGWAFDKITGAARWLWREVGEKVFKWLADKAKWLYREGIRPAFDWISDKAKWLYSKGLKPAFDKMREGVDNLKRAFEKAKDGIGAAWEKLKDVSKRPVRFFVETVYNQGLVRVWNATAAKLPGIGKLDEMKLPRGFATGGVLPGYTPGKDVHRFYSPTGGLLDLSGGEAVMRPEFTRAVGKGTIDALNAAARQGGVQGVRSALTGGLPRQAFWDGGIIGDLWDKAKNSSVGQKIGDVVGKGVDWARESLAGFARRALKSLLGSLSLPERKNPTWETAIRTVPVQMANKLIKFIKGKEAEGEVPGSVSVAGYRPSAGVKQWTSVVLQALNMVGQPASLLNTTLRRMQQESGGNPTIVNKWDSNWLAGYPSVGLMQVIRPTFQAYAGRMRNKGPFSYGVSVDPLANVYASMRYALAQYGSLSRAYNRPGGYDQGGWLPQGVSTVVNQTGKPEAILNPQQWDAMVALAEKAKRDMGGGKSFTIVNPPHPTVEKQIIDAQHRYELLHGH